MTATFLFVLKQLFYKSLKYLLYACVRIQSYQNCLLVKIITLTILMTWVFLFIRCMLLLTARDRPTKLSASPILLSGVGAVISAHPVCRPTAYCYSIFVHITQRDRTLDSLENISRMEMRETLLKVHWCFLVRLGEKVWIY